MGHRRENMKRARTGRTTAQEFFQVCLQCIILSVGHFPCYGSPDLTLIKASLDWFSLQGFSRGLYPKILVFMCA
jgi:hypothetical protein